DQAHTPTTITQPLTLPTPGEVRIYTLTSPDPTTAPRDWVLEGSPNGHTWTTLDRRTDQDFPWPHQTRPFAITTPTHHNHHRLTFTGTPTLTQIQLLAP
ncbi:hypothetical protein, partial [Actinokineospora bangkokensis]|uniref:hypothetical protein n=1 Tax=Actinokineospora bangkokensis TaxID=1193682 RepID=UPI0013011729